MIGDSDGNTYDSATDHALSRPVPFEERAEPVKKAIASGEMDPVGGNYTDFNSSGRTEANFEKATKDMNLNPQEQGLYKRHLDNLWGSGGVDNKDGTRSSLYSSTVTFGDKAYIVPGVHEGRILSNEEADAKAKAEGLDNLPSYATHEEANKRYQQMHDYMEKDTNAYEQYKQNRMPPGAPQEPTGALKGATPILPTGSFQQHSMMMDPNAREGLAPNHATVDSLKQEEKDMEATGRRPDSNYEDAIRPFQDRSKLQHLAGDIPTPDTIPEGPKNFEDLTRGEQDHILEHAQIYKGVDPELNDTLFGTDKNPDYTPEKGRAYVDKMLEESKSGMIRGWAWPSAIQDYIKNPPKDVEIIHHPKEGGPNVIIRKKVPLTSMKDIEPDERPVAGKQYAMSEKKAFPQEEGIDAEINAHATGLGARIQSGQGPGKAPAPRSVPEKIDKAAIKFEDGHVIEGKSHFDAVQKSFETGHDKKLDSAIDGFTTSTGRFVDRREAFKIFEAAEQEATKFHRPDSFGLRSESVMDIMKKEYDTSYLKNKRPFPTR